MNVNVFEQGNANKSKGQILEQVADSRISNNSVTDKRY